MLKCSPIAAATFRITWLRKMIGKLLFQIVKVERDVVHTVIATIRSGHCAPV